MDAGKPRSGALERMFEVKGSKSFRFAGLGALELYALLTSLAIKPEHQFNFFETASNTRVERIHQVGESKSALHFVVQRPVARRNLLVPGMRTNSL